MNQTKSMNRQNIRKVSQFLSMLLFPVTIFYFSPYLIVMGAFHGIIAGSMMTFALLFLFSIFFGRSFCAWICPGGGIGEAMVLANDQPFKAKKAKVTKFIIWVPWLMAILSGFIVAGGVSGINLLYKTKYGISVHSIYGYIVYLPIILLFYGLSLALGKRGTCHTVCWMAPFMILGSRFGKLLKIPYWGLSADAEKCIGCQRCNKTCSMSLDIMTMVQNNQCLHDDCIQCGACVDVCPKKAIELKVQH